MKACPVPRYGAGIQKGRGYPCSAGAGPKRATQPAPNLHLTSHQTPTPSWVGERRKPLLPAPAYAIPPAIWMIVKYAPCGSFKHTNRPTPSTSRTGVISVAPSPFAFARDLSKSAIAK